MLYQYYVKSTFAVQMMLLLSVHRVEEVPDKARNSFGTEQTKLRELHFCILCWDADRRWKFP